MRKLTGGMLAALLTVLVFPAPAQADPGSSWVHDVQSLTNGLDVKSVKAQCPEGEYLHGIGGTTNPGGQILTGIVPNAELTSVTVTAREQPGTAPLWSVTARAVCGSAGNYRSVGTGAGAATATAGCEGNDIVYSSGFLIRQPNPAGYITSVVPSVLLYDVTVTAYGTGADPESLAAIAICGPQYESRARTSVSSPLDSSTSKATIAGKPPMQADWGSVILGGGILIRGDRAFVDGFGPNETLTAFQSRAARLGGITGVRVKAMAAIEDTWDTVGYGTCIGHWYAIPV